MVPLRRQILFFALKTFDLVVVICSYFLTAYFVNASAGQINFADFFSMRISVHNLVIFGGMVVIWQIIFSYSGIYSKYRLNSLRSLIEDIILIASLSTLSLLLLKFLFSIEMVNETFLGVFWGLVFGLTILSRLTIKMFLKQMRLNGRNLRSLLFVGVNERSLGLARKIMSMPELGYNILGFADEGEDRGKYIKIPGLPFIKFEELQDFLKHQVVDEIMVCLPLKSFYAKASEVISSCEEQGIVVRLFADQFDLKLARSKTTEFMDNAIITLYTGEIAGGTMILKRVFDFFLSLALIVSLSPVMLLAALLIRCTSPGPVFFVQERIGLNKRRFGILKFRTMFPDAEKRMAELEHLNEASGPVFKIRNDPRITPIGRFLRKTSIDELPQLFNVLVGDMSLVGPRPLPVREYRGFDKNWHRRRFSVLPGITCLWQISGRSKISFDKWMELDMQYIDNWSLWLDLKILLVTIPIVLKGSGAA